ncbi:MAG: hypothetical protein ACC641_01500 [Acidiferrobacterales bacterium]
MNQHKRFEFQTQLSRWLHRIKNHPNQLLRLAVGILLIIGGLLWFLPVLGLWMLPLGLVILFSRSPVYWRLRRRYVAWRRERRLKKTQTKS